MSEQHRLLDKLGLSRDLVANYMVSVVPPKPVAKPKVPKVRKTSYAYQRENNPELAGMTDLQIRAYKMRQYKLKNRERIAAYTKEWQAANIERMRANALRYYHNNRDRMKAKMREWQKANPEKMKAYKDKYNLLQKLRELA